MYALNGKEVSQDRATELINDLAAYPIDSADLEMSQAQRAAKYADELHSTGGLRIAAALLLTYKA